MSKADKRVAIARDVIQQIKAGQFIMECGSWAEPCAPKKTKISQESLTVGQPLSCECCATGAMVLSSLRMFNVAVFKEIEEKHVVSHLRKHFDEEQVKMIEHVFERGSGHLGFYPIDSDISGRVSAFIRRYPTKRTNDDKMAIAIFKNIIKNKGEFVP